MTTFTPVDLMCCDDALNEVETFFNQKYPLVYNEINPARLRGLLRLIETKNPKLFLEIDGPWKVRVIICYYLAMKTFEAVASPTEIFDYFNVNDDTIIGESTEAELRLYRTLHLSFESLLSFVDHPTVDGLAKAQVDMCIMNLTGDNIEYVQRRANNTIGHLNNIWRDLKKYGWKMDIDGVQFRNYDDIDIDADYSS